jgi:hypothetical protein
MLDLKCPHCGSENVRRKSDAIMLGCSIPLFIFVGVFALTGLTIGAIALFTEGGSGTPGPQALQPWHADPPEDWDLPAASPSRSESVITGDLVQGCLIFWAIALTALFVVAAIIGAVRRRSAIKEPKEFICRDCKLVFYRNP